MNITFILDKIIRYFPKIRRIDKNHKIKSKKCESTPKLKEEKLELFEQNKTLTNQNIEESISCRLSEPQSDVISNLIYDISIPISQAKAAHILQTQEQITKNLDQLPVYEQLSDAHEIAITKGKIADILEARGQLDDALRIRQQEELPVYERLGEVRSIAITKGKIADILQARGQLDDALRILTDDLIPVFERLGEVREIAITKGQIANILFLQENQTEAINIYNRDVLPLYEYLGDKQLLLVGKSNLAIMYLQRAEEKDFSQANELLCWALHAAQQMQITEAEQIAAILQHVGMKCSS